MTVEFLTYLGNFCTPCRVRHRADDGFAILEEAWKFRATKQHAIGRDAVCVLTTSV